MKFSIMRFTLAILFSMPFLSMGMGQLEIDNYTDSELDRDNSDHKISSYKHHWANFEGANRVGKAYMTLLEPSYKAYENSSHDCVEARVVDFTKGTEQKYIFKAMNHIGFCDSFNRGHDIPHIETILSEDGSSFALTIQNKRLNSEAAFITIIQSLTSPDTLYLNTIEEFRPVYYEKNWYLIDNAKQVQRFNSNGEIIPVPDDNQKKGITEAVLKVAEEIDKNTEILSFDSMRTFITTDLSKKLRAVTNTPAKSTIVLNNQNSLFDAIREKINKHKEQIDAEAKKALKNNGGKPNGQQEQGGQPTENDPSNPQTSAKLSALKIMGIGSLVVFSVAAVSVVAYVVYNKIKEYRAKKKSKNIADQTNVA